MHISVLLNESINGLSIQAGDIFVDATLGAGGHSEEVVKRFGNDIKVIGIDANADTIEEAGKRIRAHGVSPTLIVGNYGNIDELLAEKGILGVHRVLFDAGFSSDQLSASGRGFSFQKDEPLIMTLSSTITDTTLTARDVVNGWEQKNIELILFAYGEERYARRIAQAIVKAREIKPIETTGQLAEIVKSSLPKNYERGRIHPATRTFQAIRIAVNDELKNIERGLNGAIKILKPGGRIAFISFHSLEDRIVKRSFKKMESEGLGKIITKKPIVPSDEEVEQNPRSRSAKLRIIEKI